jgi:hypothetical protein
MLPEDASIMCEADGNAREQGVRIHQRTGYERGQVRKDTRRDEASAS